MKREGWRGDRYIGGGGGKGREDQVGYDDGGVMQDNERGRLFIRETGGLLRGGGGVR